LQKVNPCLNFGVIILILTHLKHNKMDKVKKILIDHVLPFALTVGAVYIAISLEKKYPLAALLPKSGTAPATK